jgi:hypothetical protein
MHGREKLFHLYGYKKCREIWSVFTAMYFSSCAANDFDAMRGVWFIEMDMHAFPLVRILAMHT